VHSVPVPRKKQLKASTKVSRPVLRAEADSRFAQREMFHTAAVYTCRLQRLRIPQAPCPALRKLLDSALALLPRLRWSGRAGGGLQAL